MFDSICERTRRSSRRRWLKCDIQKTNLNSFYRSFFPFIFYSLKLLCKCDSAFDLLHWLLCKRFKRFLSLFFLMNTTDPINSFKFSPYSTLWNSFLWIKKKTKKSRSDIFQNHFLSLVSLIIFTPLTRDLKECFFSLLNFFIAASSFYMWCITHTHRHHNEHLHLIRTQLSCFDTLLKLSQAHAKVYKKKLIATHWN